MKKEMIAMILAGGQGSRLGVLTKNIAKPALFFGGKYRIIDFTLSNCVNSGIDTIGVLTQYQPLKLNQHIGIGIPWDLDRNQGGITILSPRVKREEGEWYSGTADSIYQNIDYIDQYQPEYVAILSGDHVYKMDYDMMLKFHKEKKAHVTLSVIEVPIQDAKNFGVVKVNEDCRVTYFEEKAAQPVSNLASMGVYIFNWSFLREKLLEIRKRRVTSNDFGKHLIPQMILENYRVYAYPFKGYWKDVGTLKAYWTAQMELTQVLPEFNLYEEEWKIYTNERNYPPQFIGKNASITTSIIPDGCRVRGEVYNSVLAQNVIIEEGAKVYDSIIMKNTVIKKDAVIRKCIISEECIIGEGAHLGSGEESPSKIQPKIYDSGITVIVEGSKIPSGVTVGKNCIIDGATTFEDYENGHLISGGVIKRKGVK